MSTLKKIKLNSNNIRYGPEPSIGSEVEQNLTINSKGQVWFTGYNYDRGSDHYPAGRKIRKNIGAEKANEILNDIKVYFNDRDIDFVCDAGSYTLSMYDGDGSAKIVYGPLILDSSLDDLCEKIRSVVGIEALFLFDGQI